MSTASKGLLAVATVALAGLAYFSYGQAHMHKGMVSAGPGGMSASAAEKSAPINACALLSDAEVSAMVGMKVEAGERRDDGDVGGKGDYAPPGTYSSTCLWRFNADSVADENPTLPMGGKRFAILNAMVWPSDKDASLFLKSFHDAFKHEIIPNDPIDLKLGDEGLWWGDGTAVRKGKKSFGMSVFLQNGDKASQRKMEENLARKILTRL